MVKTSHLRANLTQSVGARGGLGGRVGPLRLPGWGLNEMYCALWQALPPFLLSLKALV